MENKLRLESDLIKFVCSQALNNFELDFCSYILKISGFEIKIFEQSISLKEISTNQEITIKNNSHLFKLNARLKKYFFKKNDFNQKNILNEFHKKLINKN